MPSPRADTLSWSDDTGEERNLKNPELANTFLSLVRSLSSLVQEEPLVLASAEDADFFRKAVRRKNGQPTVPPPAKITIPPTPTHTPNKELSPPLIEPAAAAVPLPAPPAVRKEAILEPPPQQEPSPPLLPPIVSPPLFGSLRTLFTKTAPETAIRDDIPNDAIAKKIASRWKTKNQTAPISLLSLSEPQPQKAFLEEIAKALDVCYLPCRLIAAESIEKEARWHDFLSVADLKLVIACDYTLWQLNKLMVHYKENPTTGLRTLGSIPLFLLPDLSLYLKDPLLKRSLWKALCQKLSS